MNTGPDSDATAPRGSFRSTSRALLAFLRIYLGVILIITVLGKLTRDEPFATEMLGFLNGVARRGALPWYTEFIQQVVIPHATLFSYLVMTGELFAAISLLTGTITRLGALVAMSLFLNYMLAKGRMFWSPDSEDAAVFFIALVVFLSRRRPRLGNRCNPCQALASCTALVGFVRPVETAGSGNRGCRRWRGGVRLREVG